MQRPSNVRWRVFLILAAASFVAYVLRSTMSIAAPAMIKDLELTEIQFGWIASAFLWGYAALQFPGGIFGDKVGPRKALAIIAVLWSAGLMLTVLVPGPATASTAIILGFMMVVRFLNGIVHAPIFPVINTAVSRWFPVGGWALPIGLSSTGLTLGFAAAAPLLAWMVAEYGWRASFLVFAPLGVIVSGVWWWYARDFPAEHAVINDAEVELITAKRTAPVPTPINPPGWVRILKDRNILLLSASYACSNFVFYSVVTWFFYYLVEIRQFTTEEAGYVTATQWIAAAAGAALGGWLCDHLCKKIGLRWGSRWPIIIAQAGCAIFIVIGAYYQDPIIAVTFLALCFFCQQITEGAYWSSSIAIGNQLAGAAGGILNTGANAMGALNALIIPWLAQSFGWPFAIASNAIFTLLALVLLMFVRADEAMILD
jgi:ACS family glucarate transporter-like MFS transporter